MQKCNRANGRSFNVRAPAFLVMFLAAGLAAAQDGEWRMPARDYANTRYSDLSEISAQNVTRLKEVFSFTTGVEKGHEAAPIVAGGTIYLVTPYPNHVFALDFAGKVKWKFDPKPKASAQGVACCDVVNRGAVYDGGRLYFNTLDDQTIALDARTGRELWRTKLGDISRGETITMAPLVVKG
jgi:glucose dehydrogenase